MAFKTSNTDASTGASGRITNLGQSVVSPLSYDEVSTILIDFADTAFILFPPKGSKKFVITGISLTARKDIGVNGGVVIVYESLFADSTVEARIIQSIEMQKSTARDIQPLNIISSEGRWINIKSTDTTISASLTGYYVSAK